MEFTGRRRRRVETSIYFSVRENVWEGTKRLHLERPKQRGGDDWNKRHGRLLGQEEAALE